ncbi:flagellar motor switch protein FliG [Sphingomonas ginkgonis]|uniref:Flagellar motor switch protein FliG n=1 Tax=Sphingomonas ginkgonis TaxID=2315330 RepID=A0A429VC66_9SPHN|nr:flagellar motor switch protein FliG [Sphingomonas ginkgonis]RST31568.1 flagellar motor switch protein FliG [Sphingomonas ginkgonis]
MSAETLIERDPEQAGRPEVDGATAAAILLMLLSEEDAGEIVKTLDPASVRRIGESMFKVSSADEATVEAALDLFVERCRSVSSLAVGVEPRVRSVLTHALGNVRADNILTQIAPRSSAATLERLRWMEVETIATILRREHAQVGALVIAVLTPETAAKALAEFDGSVQADLLARAARLTKVRREAIEDLEIALADYAQGGTTSPGLKLGGTSEAAQIVNRMRKADGQKLIDSIKQSDETLGSAIEREMLVFDDLAALDGKSLGAVLRAIDGPVLSLALRGASPALLEQMLGCMSTRAAQTIRDEMAESQPVKRAEVEEAQRSILLTARKLADAGEIQMGGGEDDYV